MSGPKKKSCHKDDNIQRVTHIYIGKIKTEAILQYQCTITLFINTFYTICVQHIVVNSPSTRLLVSPNLICHCKAKLFEFSVIVIISVVIYSLDMIYIL